MSADEADVILSFSSDDVLNKKKRPFVSKAAMKKKQKMKAMYENYYKNEIVESVERDSNEKELQLERLVFGGEDDILEQLNSTAFSQEVNELGGNEVIESDEVKAKKTQPRVPAWKDADDDTILVSERAITHRRCHRSLARRSDEKYENVAREKFLKITGAPPWADLQHVKGSSDEESDEDLLKKTGNFLSPSTSLPKGTIDIRKCQNLTEANSSRDVIKSVEFHPTARVAVVAGLSGSATLYQIDGKINPQIQTIHFAKFPIFASHFSADGNELVVSSGEFGYYFSYDMIKGKISRIPWERGMEQSEIRRFTISPDGKHIIVHGRHGNMHLISARTKEWIGTLKMNGEVIATSFNSDGSKMYSHGGAGKVYIWDMASRLCCHKFTDEGCIKGTSLTVSPSGQLLSTGSDSGVVNIYEVSSVLTSDEPKPVKVLMNLTTEVTDMKFNCSSEILAMASSHKDDAVKLVHFPSRTVFSNFPNREKKLRYVNSIDLSLNSGYLLLGNNVGRVYLYRLRHYDNY